MKASRLFVNLSKSANKSKTFSVSSRCLGSASPQSKPQESAAQKENMSFTMNLFRGQLETSQIFPFPDVLSEEQRETLAAVIDPMEKFMLEENDPVRNDANASIDDKTLKGLWELGVFGLQVPTKYGGIGLTNTQYARLVEIAGANDLGVGITLGAHQSIGFKGILLVGNPEQKAKYLPLVANEQMAAFCLTEPSSGSDAGSIRSRAVLSADGKHYILNGSKIWISNGASAEIFTVFAQTPVEKDGKVVDKVTAFIVERAFGGLTNGLPEKKMGIKCSNTTELFFEDVKIPIENVLGGVGNGFKVAMNILNNGRFGMSAALSGTMKACIKQATEHATTRIQFGNRIDTYGTIQEKLARMQLLQYITESMAYMISSNMDLGSTDYHLEAAISKCFASESAWYVCDEAIQILGGMGYMHSAGLERVMRDLRIFRIFEGTNDILRLFVALTGIQYAGTHLRELQKAFKNPTANLGLIFSEAGKRAIRSAGLSNGPSMSHLVAEPLKDSAQLASKSLDIFGQAIEAVLVKYGKGVVDEQFILNRLAQAAMDNYTMAVVLSRATRSHTLGLPTADIETTMAQVWCTEASERVQTNLNHITSASHLDVYSKLATISKTVCENGGVIQVNPLNM